MPTFDFTKWQKPGEVVGFTLEAGDQTMRFTPTKNAKLVSVEMGGDAVNVPIEAQGPFRAPQRMLIETAEGDAPWTLFQNEKPVFRGSQHEVTAKMVELAPELKTGGHYWMKYRGDKYEMRRRTKQQRDAGVSAIVRKVEEAA